MELDVMDPEKLGGRRDGSQIGGLSSVSPWAEEVAGAS